MRVKKNSLKPNTRRYPMSAVDKKKEKKRGG